MSGDPLITLSPANILAFNLGSEGESTAVLSVNNSSNKKVIFKVKTTQPNFYLVRPNQQIVSPGKSETIVVALIDAEKRKIQALHQEGQPFDLDSHRFLIQHKVLDDDRYSSLSEIPAVNRNEEFAKLWNASKDERPNMKLRVQFNFADSDKPTPKVSSANRNASVSENVEALRSRLARPQGHSNAPEAGSSDPDTVFSELLSLKEKYDAVVEYTVHLTAERDSIVAQFEALQRDYAREISQRKGDAKTSAAAGKPDKSSEKQSIQQGFSVLAMVIAVFISLIIGRYMKA